RTLLELVLTEGRKREVRRMLAAVGLPLERLARVKLGPLPLGDISPGRFRPLTGAEVRQLYAAVGLGGPEPATTDAMWPPPATWPPCAAPRRWKPTPASRCSSAPPSCSAPCSRATSCPPTTSSASSSPPPTTCAASSPPRPSAPRGSPTCRCCARGSCRSTAS